MIDWARVLRLALVSRFLDDTEEQRLVPEKKVLYQFSARGHDVAQIILGQHLTHRHDAAGAYYRSRPLLLTLGLSAADGFAGPMGKSGGMSGGRDIGVVCNLPSDPGPVVLLDPLATFYDENVPLQEVRRLSATCLRHMERLRQHAPVLVVVPPAPAAAGRAFLLENLCQAASGVHLLERPAPVSPQPALL